MEQNPRTPPHRTAAQQLRSTVTTHSQQTISSLEAELEAMKTAKEALKRSVEGTSGELKESQLRVRELEAECQRLREEVCEVVELNPPS